MISLWTWEGDTWRELAATNDEPWGRERFGLFCVGYPPALLLLGGADTSSAWLLHSDLGRFDARWPADGEYLPSEVCSGGIDEDGDGLIDCEDPDCSVDPGC